MYIKNENLFITFVQIINFLFVKEKYSFIINIYQLITKFIQILRTQSFDNTRGKYDILYLFTILAIEK